MSGDNKFPNIACREILRFQISNTCIPGVRGAQGFYNTAECMPNSAVRQAPPSLSVLAKHCKLWNSLLRPCASGGIYPKRHDWYRETPRPAQDKISVVQRSFALHSQIWSFFKLKQKTLTKQQKKPQEQKKKKKAKKANKKTKTKQKPNNKNPTNPNQPKK